ncbi:MotA/TolQ/ExbB proton channel family protein [Thioalkalivibrio sp. XN8]|uniref:MotA/TolQ/ExbB proton channel family protein n=1 Tax=Thioalkalivibrio sp. XN8 TaxID=2712863 RepID=UPI0013EDEED1|nr:MotA/TolQ/ExbB proton channel family protein [Thioalkalivibrio sp. XN8]NGP54207.1 energy transducer TonB [Thioalkalivibrio sp. XN8]
MNRLKIVAVALSAGMLAAPAVAQEQAPSLAELLQRVEQGQVQDRREFQQREAEFRAAQADQERLLQEARAERGALEAESERLEGEYEANEARVAELEEALNRRLGSLKELFGVLQLVSSDTQGLFENSIINIQYPDRTDFLQGLTAKMSSSSQLASIDDLERLWFELQREMTEQGRVLRFPTEIFALDGTRVQEEIVRVGAFNIIAGDKFLQFTPETGNVAVMPRQPERARFTRSAGNLFAAVGEDTMVPFAVDPTRGQILGLLTEKPNLVERIQQGGVVGYVIIGLGILALLLAAERLISLGLASRKVSAQLNASAPDSGNPLGRLLLVAQQNAGRDTETLELKLGEAMLHEMPALNRGVLFLKIISIVAPLLGLLGTVTGMIVTFQAITLFGTGDPKLMAGGISQALVTTVLGLVVAIPVVFLHTLVNGRARRIQHILQEQAAGVVAERAEELGGDGHGPAMSAVAMRA